MLSIAYAFTEEIAQAAQDQWTQPTKFLTQRTKTPRLPINSHRTQRGGKVQTEEAVKRLERMAKASEAANVANKNALAATLTQNRDALDQTIEQSRLDQRPWVVTGEFKMDKDLSVSGNEPEITIAEINTGKTPALGVIPQGVIIVTQKEPTPSPNWFSYTSIVESTHTHSRGILAPGATNFSFTLDKRRINAQDIADYTANKSGLFLQAIIRYDDVWDRPHWTTVCFFHVSGKPTSEWGACEHGNDVDHAKQQP